MPTLGITLSRAVLVIRDDYNLVDEETTTILEDHLNDLAENLDEIDQTGFAGYDDPGTTLQNLVQGLSHAYVNLAEGNYEDGWPVNGTDRFFVILHHPFDNQEDADLHEKTAALVRACELIPGLGEKLGIYGSGVIPT